MTSTGGPGIVWDVSLTVGIDEVGYGPSLGPLVVTAVASRRRLPASLLVGDSKKIFSQVQGVRTLEPTVLGVCPAATFSELLSRLSAPPLAAPWYEAVLELPKQPKAGRLEGSWARLVEAAEFNARTRDQNKSELLFEVVADLIRKILRERRGPIRFVVGKQGGRHFYLRDIQELVSPTVMVVEETPRRSVYTIPGASIEFLVDAEDQHELVALASMIGKYVRECAMRLFNEWFAARRADLRPTAGYGADGRRFFRDIAPLLEELRIEKERVVRLR